MFYYDALNPVPSGKYENVSDENIGNVIIPQTVTGTLSSYVISSHIQTLDGCSLGYTSLIL